MKRRSKMSTWAVVYVIHVHTPYRHIPQLFIENVPEEIEGGELRSLLTKAGYQFGEFGIPWANHYLAPQDKWKDEVVGVYKSGDVKTISYNDIAPQEEIRRVTVRIPVELHEKLKKYSNEQNLSINTIILQATLEYLQKRGE
jgi:hypothetical protein